MVDRVIPKVMQSEQPEVADSKTAETSRVQNVDPSKCAICGNTLVAAKANGLDVLMCAEHRIYMPVKDN